MLARLRERISTPDNSASPTSKTPGSTRALRKKYARLQSEGHIVNKDAVLVRAGEKLAINNQLLRKEVEGFRTVIFEEKRKRERGKALKSYEEDKHQAGQAVFFSPAKVTRIR